MVLVEELVRMKELSPSDRVSGEAFAASFFFFLDSQARRAGGRYEGAGTTCTSSCLYLRNSPWGAIGSMILRAVESCVADPELVEDDPSNPPGRPVQSLPDADYDWPGWYSAL